MSTSVKRSPTGRYWAVLLVSAALESVWALALSASQGFTILIPSLIFLIAGAASLAGLSYAMRGIPLSVSYAVWTGTGAALTATISMMLGTEPFSALKVLFLVGIIACVVALKFAPSAHASSAAEQSSTAPITGARSN